MNRNIPNSFEIFNRYNTRIFKEDENHALFTIDHEYNANNQAFLDYFSQYNKKEIEYGSYKKIAGYLQHNLVRVEVVPRLLQRLKTTIHRYDHLIEIEKNTAHPYSPIEMITIKRNLKYERKVYRSAILHLQELISLTNKEISHLTQNFKPTHLKNEKNIGKSIVKSLTGMTAVENIIAGAESNDDRRFLRGIASLTLKLTGIGLLADAFEGAGTAEEIVNGHSWDGSDLLAAGLTGYLLYDTVRDVKPLVSKYLAENFSQKQKNGPLFLYTFDFRNQAKEELKRIDS